MICTQSPSHLSAETGAFGLYILTLLSVPYELYRAHQQTALEALLTSVPIAV